MRETPAGLLVAEATDGECKRCARCTALAACPGAGLDLGLSEDLDPFRGPVRQAYLGHAADPEIRLAGQSGGAISALLLSLLASGDIDAALTTVMPEDGLRPYPLLARTRADVLSARGSKYCPMALNAGLGDVDPGTRLAFVGLPCHMHGIHRLEETQRRFADVVRARIGLVCDRTLMYSAVDLMARDAGLRPESVASLEYRSKARSGWPGEVRFRLRSGGDVFVSSAVRTRIKDYFTPPRCRICFDKMNVLADVTVGDAWGFPATREGESVLLARTERGIAILDAAVSGGFLVLTPVEAEPVFAGQQVDAKAAGYSAFCRSWSRRGGTLPQYSGVGEPVAGTSDAAKSETSPGRRHRRDLDFGFRVASSGSAGSAVTRVRMHRIAARARRKLRRIAGRTAR